MNKSELHKLASMLEDEACDMRIMAGDGVAGHHARILGRSAAKIDSVAHTLRLIANPIESEDFDPSKAITDPFKRLP